MQKLQRKTKEFEIYYIYIYIMQHRIHLLYFIMFY